jgi:hypothetical protein
LSALVLAFAASPVAARTLGLVADNATVSVTVFDAETNTVVGSVPVGPDKAIGDVLLTRDQKLGFVTNYNYQVFVIDVNGPAPSLVNTIPINNFGEDLTLSPDGKYLLVSDGTAVQPIDVIDVASRTVVSSFATETDTNAIDACSDGSVLATSARSNSVRRLTLNRSGILAATGETLSVNGPTNVYCAPGAKSGLVVNFADNTMTSFLVPGLYPVDTRTLSGSFGVSGVISSLGDRVYARSNGISKAIDQFGFNAATGALSATPLWSSPLAFSAPALFGMEQMALRDDKLYVSG